MIFILLIKKNADNYIFLLIKKKIRINIYLKKNADKYIFCELKNIPNKYIFVFNLKKMQINDIFFTNKKNQIKIIIKKHGQN